jgi:hypothetical protein
MRRNLPLVIGDKNISLYTKATKNIQNSGFVAETMLETMKYKLI